MWHHKDYVEPAEVESTWPLPDFMFRCEVGILIGMICLHKKDACGQGGQEPTSLSWMLVVHVPRRPWVAYLILKIWLMAFRCLEIWFNQPQCIKIGSLAKPKIHPRSAITCCYSCWIRVPNHQRTKPAVVINCKEISSGEEWEGKVLNPQLVPCLSLPFSVFAWLALCYFPV